MSVACKAYDLNLFLNSISNKLIYNLQLDWLYVIN